MTKTPRRSRHPILMGIASIGAGLASMADAFSGRPSPRMRRLQEDLKLGDAERMRRDRLRMEADRKRLMGDGKA